jgi:DNA-binding HxlR family transcriptional regulator
MEILGGKWRAPLLWWLGQRPRHFGELRRRLPDISAKVLTQQLRALEEYGLLVRLEEPSGRLTRVRYRLLPAGIELLPLLDQLCAWGATLPDVKLEAE